MEGGGASDGLLLIARCVQSDGQIDHLMQASSNGNHPCRPVAAAEECRTMSRSDSFSPAERYTGHHLRSFPQPSAFLADIPLTWH
ncbi:hypothetical protein TNCV_3308681 [Trichonephila clavipes]|nr:hypothetical protein TNCV_3308681 [Trichonephila clavipes]